MLLNMSYHNVDKSYALDDYLKEKLNRMNRHLHNVGSVRFSLNKEADLFSVSVECEKEGRLFFSKNKAKNAYVAASEVLKKMKRWLSK